MKQTNPTPALNIALPTAGYNTLPVFEDVFLPLGDLKVSRTGREYSVSVDGQTFEASDRFRDSFLGQIGQGQSIFNLFEFEEVVDRFRTRRPSKADQVRLVVDVTNNQALGLSQPDKPSVAPTRLLEILHDQAEAEGCQPRFRYERGRIVSEHTPAAGFERARRTIGGQDLSFRFFHDCPVDGYGSPSVFVGLLREICQNGAVAMCSAFRRPVSLGKGHPERTVARVLAGFSIGDTAVTELEARMESAIGTPASVREARSLFRIFSMITSRSTTLGSANLSRLERDTKQYAIDICDSLGVANLNVFDEKPSGRAPIDFSVFDLINMATEMATHFNTGFSDKLHGWIGRTITENYDLEGLELQAPSPTDFFFLDREEQLALAS